MTGFGWKNHQDAGALLFPDLVVKIHKGAAYRARVT